jgi:putative ABC transport system permease protein
LCSTVDSFFIGSRTIREPLVDLAQDVKYAIRQFARSPTFTAVAILTLTLGIGVNTAIFSVVNAVLLRPLPYPHPEQLGNWLEKSQDNFRLPSYLTFMDWRQQSRLVDFGYIRGVSLLMPTSEGPARTLGAFVSSDFFGVMGVHPVIGRTPSTEDERRSAGRVAVLSFGFWQRRYAGEQTVLGRSVTLNEIPYTVVGVMPRDFAFPAWADVWMPIAALPPTDRSLVDRGIHVDGQLVGRLRPGVTWAQARTEMDGIAARLATAYPAENGKWTASQPQPLAQQVTGDARPRLLIIAVAAALVLLVGCANLANLLLARGEARGREWGIRLALGASRGRVLRQVLAENGVLALAGGALGFGLAAAATSLLRQAAGTAALPRANDVRVDASVLLFSLILSLLTIFGVGVLPALQAGSSDVIAKLKEATTGGGSPNGRARVRRVLIVSEVALALALLVGAGLLIRSFWTAIQVDPGYQPDHLVAVDVFPPSPKYADGASAVSLYRRLEEAVAMTPGVRNAGLSNGPGIPTRFQVTGRESGPGAGPAAAFRVVSASFFRTLGIRMVQGREFNDLEIGSANPVAVVNETFARLYLQKDSVVGTGLTVYKQSQIRSDLGQPIHAEIIGVARDVHWRGPDREPDPEVFLPYTINSWGHMFVFARVQGDTQSAIAGLRRSVLAVEPNIPLAGAVRSAGFGFRSMDDDLSGALAPRRFSMLLLGLFALVAMILAVIGIYGVTSYLVALRTRELALRVALGAESAMVVRQVVGQGMKLVIIGVAIGVAAAWGLSRLMAGLLFGVNPRDPWTFTAAAVLFGLVGLLASYLPARTVAKLNPMVVLKSQ